MGARMLAGMRTCVPSSSSVDVDAFPPPRCRVVSHGVDPDVAAQISNAMEPEGRTQTHPTDAEALAWQLLLRAQDLNDSKTTGGTFPSGDALERWVKDAKDILAIAPPTEFSLVSVAAHTLSQDCKPKGPPPVDSDPPQDVSIQQEIARINEYERETPTVISLASCLNINEVQPNQTSKSAPSAGNQLSPRVAAFRASRICERYRHVIRSAHHQRLQQTSSCSDTYYRMSAGEHRGKNRRSKDSAFIDDDGHAIQDLSPKIDISALSINVAATQLLEKYQATIAARSAPTSYQSGLFASSSNHEGIVRNAHDRSKQVPIDAGSGGTADSSVTGMERRAKLVGGSGGTYSSDGTSDGDSSHSRSPTGITLIEKHSLEVARSSTPWTYSFFFDEEGDVD